MKIKLNKVSYLPTKKGPKILDEIDSVFEKGYIYGVLGPNGAGKTTLVKSLIRLNNISSGSINYDEISVYDIPRSSLAKKVSFLPQDTAIAIEFTVYDIIAMGRTPHIKRFSAMTQADIDAVLRAMELTNVKHLRDRDIRSLSGGERQRVILARCIAQETKWIVLDEPVANLDIKHQIELMKLMTKMKNRQEKSVVAVLHDINLALKYCDKIILMRDGKIFKQGFAKDVINEKNLREVFEVDFDFQRNEQKDIIFVVPRD